MQYLSLPSQGCDSLALGYTPSPSLVISFVNFSQDGKDKKDGKDRERMGETVAIAKILTQKMNIFKLQTLEILSKLIFFIDFLKPHYLLYSSDSILEPL